ncbi:hypothetical protein [Stenotrophomonas sp.]|uniref:hypothetical protein n=1 Tax=Stenotrophomonas sp. TaxID=69392 RepID=UPI002FC618D0
MELQRVFNDGSAWQFGPYFDYLREIAPALPPALRAFALDVDRYDLQGAGSLHDARMSSFTVIKSSVDGSDGATVRLEVVFLDQAFAGELVIVYTGVSGYRLQESFPLERPGVDVLVHEFALLEAERFEHRVLFEDGGGYVVTFAGFSCSHRPLTPSAADAMAAPAA